MTLIYKLDLDIVKMYLHIKIKFMGEDFQKLEYEQYRDTHRHTRPNAVPRRIRGYTTFFVC